MIVLLDDSHIDCDGVVERSARFVRGSQEDLPLVLDSGEFHGDVAGQHTHSTHAQELAATSGAMSKLAWRCARAINVYRGTQPTPADPSASG